MASQPHHNEFSGDFQSSQWLGNKFETSGGNIHFQISGSSNDEIDRSCLRVLRCPDSFAVKNRLRESKDKLFYKCFDWILRDPHYVRWQDEEDVSLLWIKGGAGKGKTMMTIGLVERFSLPQDDSVAVTYFFCQNADYELNNVAAIIKGLILRLVDQHKELKESLRLRWDSENKRFTEDISSWRTLWNIFVEMLNHCKCRRVYVVVDALDECQGEGMTDLLKLIVRTGLDHIAKIKWLLTSRPMDTAERELLAWPDQVRVSLELSSKHVSEAVRTYISYKVAELDHRHHYGPELRRKVETELTQKAEDTFLWVSLVCKRLEDVSRDKALITIQDLPPGLHHFYDRIFSQLGDGDSHIVEGCLRLMDAMMLAYRPLHVREISSVTGLPDDQWYIEALIDRSASFVKIRDVYAEFVHQSARDYLADKDGRSLLEFYDQYGHGEIAINCLTHLSRRLKVNLLELPQPDATRETREASENPLLASLDYAASFWFLHLEVARCHSTVQDDAVAQYRKVEIFFRTRFLEWLECLSLLDQLQRAVKALEILADTFARSVPSQPQCYLSVFLQEATRFLLRHYQTVLNWPLQIYSSAIIFSPKQSMVRSANVDKIPRWLTQLPIVEEEWTSLVKTLTDHSDEVSVVEFSPDGRYIASGSIDNTIKVWDATTGEVRKTLADHSYGITAVSFSPDSRYIVSGSWDNTIKVWDVATEEVKKTLAGHSDGVVAVSFSTDSRYIASGSMDKTIKVWDVTTGEIKKILARHSNGVHAVAFSPDSRYIVSGCRDKIIKVWDMVGEDEKVLIGHSDEVNAVAFSPDCRYIASGSWDDTIKLWDIARGKVEKTLVGHSRAVSAVVFAPDGQHVASGSFDNTVKVWDTATGEAEKTLVGHSRRINAVAFSPDGRYIASGSADKTVRMWDVMTGKDEKAGHSDMVSSVAFSPNGQYIASGSFDNTVKVWDVITGKVKNTLVGHSNQVHVVAFSSDSQYIASGSVDRTIRIWDVVTGMFEKMLIGHLDEVHAVAFSPDCRYIASGSWDNTINLWDVMTGEIEKTLVGHSNGITAVAFSFDGRYVASGSRDRAVKVWDASTGIIKKTLSGHSDNIHAVAFSPDGRHVASGSWDNTIRVWDVIRASTPSRLLDSPSGRRPIFQASRKINMSGPSREAWRIQEINTPGPVCRLHFSADGTLLTTDVGLFKVEVTTMERQRQEIEPAYCLHVQDQWIHYARPVLRLSADLTVTCDDVHGNQLVIGLADGRVLIFTIDCKSLLGTLHS